VYGQVICNQYDVFLEDLIEWFRKVGLTAFAELFSDAWKWVEYGDGLAEPPEEPLYYPTIMNDIITPGHPVNFHKGVTPSEALSYVYQNRFEDVTTRIAQLIREAPHQYVCRLDGSLFDLKLSGIIEEHSPTNEVWARFELAEGKHVNAPFINETNDFNFLIQMNEAILNSERQ